MDMYVHLTGGNFSFGDGSARWFDIDDLTTSYHGNETGRILFNLPENMW